MIPVACAFHSPIVAPAQVALGPVSLHGGGGRAPGHGLLQHIGGAIPEGTRRCGGATGRTLGSARGVCAGNRVDVRGRRSRFRGGGPAQRSDEPGRADSWGAPQAGGGIEPKRAAGRDAPACTSWDNWPRKAWRSKLDRLYRDRSVRRLDLSALQRECGEKPLAPSVWLVNGARARPVKDVSTQTRTPGGGLEGDSANAPR